MSERVHISGSRQTLMSVRTDDVKLAAAPGAAEGGGGGGHSVVHDRRRRATIARSDGLSCLVWV
eukprot:COSAG01_NODE_13188_length_1623_cov_1.093832_2_plen_63_part_01